MELDSWEILFRKAKKTGPFRPEEGSADPDGPCLKRHGYKWTAPTGQGARGSGV
ncbi:hypothetical protein QA601_00035 [Chitinispirillales bacterium ANBcel5]|uniref:hypothetical protein n=1 Tax=Cellulosispirillum alkaliphilum TaxID=3039283 RepID=UPI002A51E715|nr:hypothetical protein [Chitinispirillales bacterium ANBcel5]